MAPLKIPLALHRSRRIFLTGATGFLGAFLLLDSLLLRTQATVYCLVRAPKGESSMKPIRENLRQYGLWRAGRERRIVPVAGDLGEPLLGTTEERFQTLSREIDVVIHAAARVNLVYPYDVLKNVNVDGTREVLRLACHHKTKPLHFVSTNGIFPPGGHKCEENADLDTLAGAREDGYGQTKWVAEKLVRQAADRGLPVNVYRPGNIAGHSISGISNPRDFLGAVIAESLRIGAAPRIEGWRVEMTPVDFVSGAICHLAEEPDSAGRTFHLAEPDPVPADKVFGWFGEMGYPLEQLDYPDWLEAWRAAPNPESGGGVVEGVLSGTAPEAHELWDGNLYDDSNTQQVLGKTGLRRPDLNPSLLGNYARHFADRESWVGKNPNPSAAIMDSQSTKTTEECRKPKPGVYDAHSNGYDAHKHIKGRKRHLLVDTLGLPLSIYVSPADTQERIAARWLLAGRKLLLLRLKKIWADGAYSGDPLYQWCQKEGGWGWVESPPEKPTGGSRRG